MPSVGTYRQLVVLEEPGPLTPDPDGGYTDTWIPLDPTVWACSIQQASARTLEALGAGSVVSQATHLVRGRYHPGITTHTRLTFDGRTLSVIYVANRDARSIETDLVCAEVVP